MDNQSAFDNMVSGSEPVQPEDQSDTDFIGGVEADFSVERSAAMSIYSAKPKFDQGDIFIPRLRLAQGLTKEVGEGHAKPGDWVVSGYDALSELTVIPLMFAKRRELVDSSFQVHCKSDDAETGVGDPGGVCHVCPKGMFTKGPKDKNLPPECSFVYSYIVYIVEHDIQAILEFKRTALGVGRSINTLLAKKGLGNVAVVMKSTSAQGPKGTYHTPTMSSATVPEEVMDLARASS